jgi:hypothetical protein
MCGQDTAYENLRGRSAVGVAQLQPNKHQFHAAGFSADRSGANRDPLSAAHAEAETNGVVRYYPCTLSASFNVASATSVGGSLALSASPSTDSIVSELSGSHSSSQGNQVTVLLASPMCAPSFALKGSDNSKAQQQPVPTTADPATQG